MLGRSSACQITPLRRNSLPQISSPTKMASSSKRIPQSSRKISFTSVRRQSISHMAREPEKPIPICNILFKKANFNSRNKKFRIDHSDSKKSLKVLRRGSVDYLSSENKLSLIASLPKFNYKRPFSIKKNSTEQALYAWTRSQVDRRYEIFRYGATCVLKDDRIYIIGGQGSPNPIGMKILNTKTYQCENFPLSLKKCRIGHSSILFKNKLYIYGGYSHQSTMGNVWKCYTSILVIHLVKKRTYKIRTSGNAPVPRRNHCAAKVGRNMIVYGGMDALSVTLNSLHIFDLLTETWNLVRSSAKPPPRSHASFVPIFNEKTLADQTKDLACILKEQKALNRGLYLFGGKNCKSQALGDLWRLCATGSKISWEPIDATGEWPAPRYDHSAVYLKLKMFVYGGRNDGLGTPNQGLGEVSVLHIKSLIWEKLQINGEEPIARWSCIMAGVGERIIVFGGMCHQSQRDSSLWSLKMESQEST